MPGGDALAGAGTRPPRARAARCSPWADTQRRSGRRCSPPWSTPPCLAALAGLLRGVLILKRKGYNIITWDVPPLILAVLSILSRECI